ncbi:MAG: gliding motility-associated C-terminal domain-containing protein [Vicingaceae bacterium]
MKKFTYLLFASLIILFLTPSNTFAQPAWASGYIEIDYAGPTKYPQDLPVDWEYQDFIDYSTTSIQGGEASLADDPLNPNNTVLKLSKPAGVAFSDGGSIISEELARPIDFALNATNIVNAYVYATEPNTTVRMRIEDVVGGSVVEAEAAPSSPNSWEKLNFDFDNPINGTFDPAAVYQHLTLTINHGTIADDEEIYVDSIYVPNQITNTYCNIGDSLNIVFHFYRDFFVSALEPSKTVTLSSIDLGISRDITLDNLVDLGVVEQYCLTINGNERTEGALYSTSVPEHLPPARDWKISFQAQFRSPRNNNVPGLQEYYIETKLNNFKCGRLDGLDASGQAITRFNERNINTVHFTNDAPVASFCVNREYTYTLPAIDEMDQDELSFSLEPARSENASTLVNYAVPNFPFDYPFPIQEPFLAFNKNTGSMTFTPSSIFRSVVNFKINEKRGFYVKSGQLVSLDDTLSTTTFYETRFILDNNCKSQLADFEGAIKEEDPVAGEDRWFSTYDPLEDAYEFDCGTDTMTFNLSRPMLCATIQKEDFRIAFTYNDITDLAAYVDEVYFADVDLSKKAINPRYTNGQCSPSGEFNQVTLVLNRGLGPGQYNIFFKHGNNDFMTIKNRCDYDFPINQPYVKFFINDELTYEHPENLYIYCNPADLSTAYAEAWQRGEIAGPGKSYYTWRPNPADPSTKKDTVLPSTNIKKPDGTFYKISGEEFDTNKQAYNVPGKNPQEQGRGSRYRYDTYPESNPNPNISVSDGIWEVGFGLDYSVYDPQTGDTVSKKVCYDTDQFTVRRFDNPEVDIPDYDLCPEDDWPTVNLGKFVTEDNADPNQFVFRRMLTTFNKIPTDQQIANGNWTAIFSGNYKLKLPAQETNKFNVFATDVPFVINGHTCVERDSFIVLKTEVDAQLRTDTIICPNEPIDLVNTGEYLLPDKVTYKWFHEDAEIPGATIDTFPTSLGEGEYKIEVTKSSEIADGVFSTCSSKDSVLIGVADVLDSTNVACKDVTFKDGNIIQNYNWDVVAGADGYEVRGISPFGDTLPWEDANGLNGIEHEIFGQQMKLQVRPYNNEVAESASCKYGPAIIGETCDINVRPINVFTPNGDGINDFLAFTLLEVYPGSQLQIFNRWGELIYEDDNYFNDWDGENYKEGTYYYILKVNDEIEYPEPFKGTFTIIR